MQQIKIINEYMQDLKLKLNRAQQYDIELKKLNDEYDYLLVNREILKKSYKMSMRVYKIKCILSLGVLYIKSRKSLDLFKEIFAVANNELDENIEQILAEIYLLDDDKELEEFNKKNYEQMSNFLDLIKSMDENDARKYLSYKM